MTAAYEFRTSLTIARGHLDLLRRSGADAPEIAIALEELDVIEAIASALLRRTGEEVDQLSLAPGPSLVSRPPFFAVLGLPRSHDPKRVSRVAVGG